jgi:hypothetical protein
VPGLDAVSFVHRIGEETTIEILDLASGDTEPLVQPFPENVYHAWVSPAMIVTARDSRLYTFMPGTDVTWVPGPDLAARGIRGISRIAVSPDGALIALVGVR